VDEQSLRAFGALIIKLQGGENLTRAEAFEAYRQIFQNRQPDLQQGALVAAHVCVPPTVEALVGVTEAHNEEWNRCLPHTVQADRPHMGIVGVGLDSLKSFNVSSAAAVVASACGVLVHKVGAPGMTSPSGSADAFAHWGLELHGPLEAATAGVASDGLGFTTPINQQLRMGIGRVLSQLRCKTVIHLAGPMGFHGGERHKIIGVPAPPLGGLMAEAMRILGYEAAMLPCGTATGHPGRFMDEFSTLGPTHVARLLDGEVQHVTLTPADFGVAEAHIEDIAAGRTSAESARFGARAIAGLTPGPLEDLLATNAAACLVLMGAASDWADGTRQARAAIHSGKAIRQLEGLVVRQAADAEVGLATLRAHLGK